MATSVDIRLPHLESVSALKLALQAQTKSAIMPTTNKKASSAQGYATSVTLATGWREGIP